PTARPSGCHKALSCLMLIRLFQHNSICWDRVLVERPGKVCAASYLLIRGRLAPGPETKQGLERGHGLPTPIMAKDEFIKINLKLCAFEIRNDGHSSAPGYAAAFLHSH